MKHIAVHIESLEGECLEGESDDTFRGVSRSCGEGGLWLKLVGCVAGVVVALLYKALHHGMSVC